MENITRQMRVRFSGAEQESKDDLSSNTDLRRPPQKTLSYRDKKTQNWIQGQFSRNMSQDYDSGNDIEHVTAVAAAAYAVNSLESTEVPIKSTGETPETPLTKIKSIFDDIRPYFIKLGSLSERPSDKLRRITGGKDEKEPTRNVSNEDMPERVVTPSPSMKRTSTFEDKLFGAGKHEPEIASPEPEPTPSIKKTPAFSDMPLNNIGSTKPERPALKPDQPDDFKTSTPTPPPPPPPPLETKMPTSMKPGVEEAKANAWERAELAKIKERYEKLNATINDWERKKKEKARRRLAKREGRGDTEQKRARALEKYQSDIQYIEEIAGGARAQAEERRRNEELKAKEKANIIRATGELPATCFCF